MPGSRAAGCEVATILGCGLGVGFNAAGFAAGFVVTVGFLATGFWSTDFLAVAVFDLGSRAAVCLATSFLAAAVALPPGFRAVAVVLAGFRADEPDEAGFWVALFADGRLVPEFPARAVFGCTLRIWVAFGWETFTRPRMARPDDLPFAAAFTVARRVDLLCEVEAMGTALVTVATWCWGQWQATGDRAQAPPRHVDTGE